MSIDQDFKFRIRFMFTPNGGHVFCRMYTSEHGEPFVANGNFSLDARPFAAFREDFSNFEFVEEPRWP